MEWTTEKSEDLYGIPKWGEGFFGVNQKGEMTVFPIREDRSVQISLKDVVDEMKEQNVAFPAVIRFQDVLRSRVEDLNKAFNDAILENNYCSEYKGVYPVKVNQMREVVEEIVDAGNSYSFGLEAGSKAELMSILSMDQSLNSLTILNGYKDEDYLRLAFIGQQIGRNIIVVIEKLSELKQIIQLSKEYSSRPMIGIRSRLGFKSKGKWEGSSGDKAKFGLCAAEIVHAINLLRENNYLDGLKLFHFHIGSQIPSISSIQEAISEGARTFVEICKLGAPLEFFDVGGGLGVDYDGSGSDSDSSINYSVQEYANDVVKTLMEICDKEELPHPHIVSESGRAITAHHSCVITKVIGEIDPSSRNLMIDTKGENENEEGEYLKNMIEVTSSLNEENYVAVFNTIQKLKKESYHAFKLGVVNLCEKAKLEQYYWQCAREVLSVVRSVEPESELRESLEGLLSTQYLCNFSVFQSAADSWAIKQLLPVAPITKLNEEPTQRASLVDITCDSDGKIDNFSCYGENQKHSFFHSLDERDYYVGIFLTGAYQDVMGDMHNLFGRLNEVHVYCHDDDPNDFYIEEIISGQKASHVLKTMQYNPEIMAYKVKKQIDRQISKGSISPRAGVKMTDFYESTLYGPTYLKN